ncbi:MAG: DUF5715 family protein [Acidobacteriota bacterium]
MTHRVVRHAMGHKVPRRRYVRHVKHPVAYRKARVQHIGYVRHRAPAHRMVRHAVYRPVHRVVHPVIRRAVRPAAMHSAVAVAVTATSRIHYVAPMRGSRASLLRQNQRDAAEGLVRIQNQAQLLQLEHTGKLVPLPVSAALQVNPHMRADRRYCRPWTAKFLAELARVHYERFHKPLQVTSAVRPASYQRELMRINGNAAPVTGPIASPHESGAAIDIGKKGMSWSEILWMRDYLLPLQTEGKIDVEEEFYESCFHIDVYNTYAPKKAPARPIATLLATEVR